MQFSGQRSACAPLSAVCSAGVCVCILHTPLRLSFCARPLEECPDRRDLRREHAASLTFRSRPIVKASSGASKPGPSSRYIRQPSNHWLMTKDVVAPVIKVQSGLVKTKLKKTGPSDIRATISVRVISSQCRLLDDCCLHQEERTVLCSVPSIVESHAGWTEVGLCISCPRMLW